MSSEHLHMPEGTYPLIQRIHRERQAKQPQELTLPEAHLWVGRDLDSSGATLSVWEPTGGMWASYSVLWAARWLEPVLTTEGAVRNLAAAAARAVAELFGPDVPS